MGQSRTASVNASVSPEEWEARVHLAACYRLVAIYGWDDLVFTHVSARVPGPEHHFLINPYGWLFEEITASSPVKVDIDGNIVEATDEIINPAGFTIHSCIHAARPDVHCVLHTHTPAGVAVSATREGLLPLSQSSLFPLSSLAYHDYEGVALDEDEQPRLVADLGDKSVMILRNHGLLTAGPTIADAFLYMYFLEWSCKTQIMAQSTGRELVPIPGPVLAKAASQARAATGGRMGMIAWPGLLRKLDRVDPTFRD